jgi:hypothetical protein
MTPAEKVNALAGLTVKAQALYAAIDQGMDEPGSGWLHELADESLSTNGVLGSLVKKGLVVSSEIKEKGCPVSYWVALAG